MYDGARTAVKCHAGLTESFEIKVGVHQGSCLSPLLFIIVMDAISDGVRAVLPWDILYADDLVIGAETPTDMQTRFTAWQDRLEGRGFKINASKTETMSCAKAEEKLEITDNKGNKLRQVETFKYLGAVLSANGGCESDVKNRIKAAWSKWREVSGVVCDKNMSKRVKGKVYKTMIRPVLMYGAETWALRKKDEVLLERTEMRMLRWILGVSLKDKLRNEDIRNRLEVVNIKEKVREARLRWFGHVERQDADCFVKRIMKAEVVGRRSRGRQKKRWRDKIQEDLTALQLTADDASDRDSWRKRIHAADPSTTRDNTA